MLLSLKINDVAIIKEANIIFEKGLNIMTGETGSGKSIIIDSINTILGDRTSKELIRDTADYAKVTAVFVDVSQNAKTVLNKYNIECEDDTLLIQRTIKDGRNICKINGENVTVSILKEVGKHLINIHGQNDNQDLLDVDNHIIYLDMMTSNEKLFREYQEKYYKLKEINSLIRKLSSAENEKERKIENLRFQIDEIENANIREGEFEELKFAKVRAQNLEKVKGELNKLHIITEGDDLSAGILTLSYDLLNVLNNLSECYPETKSYIPLLNENISSLAELSKFCSNELFSSDDNNCDLNAIEERIDTIYRIMKKYGDTETEILSFLNKAKREMNSLELNTERIEEATNNYNQTLEELLIIGNKLTQSRKKSADELSRKISKELQFLDMNGAVFSVDIRENAVTPTGLDEVEFLVSTNPGQSLKPLVKIASGGELSRIMLAIKCVLMNKDNVDTMIFDEIDSGVSGRAAEKIGIKLKEVSKFSQVICVTHLAQIACFANNHLYIEKNTLGENVNTTVRSLNYNEKKAEIARIMGGSLISEATLSSAEELLKLGKSFDNE